MPFVHWLLGDRPADVGLRPYGAADLTLDAPLPPDPRSEPAEGPTPGPVALALGTLRDALGRWPFWPVVVSFSCAAGAPTG